MKHDEIVSEIKNRMDNMGLATYDHQDYVTHKKCGEIDVYGINLDKKLIIAVEVKETYSVKSSKKAHRQLKRDITFLLEKFPNSKIKTICAYGNKNNKRGYELESYIIK